MKKQNPQQIFNFQLAPANTFATYNDVNVKALTASLQNLVKQDITEAQLFIWGSANTGKTHLLQAVCHLLATVNKRVMYIPLSEFKSYQVDLFDGLESIDIVCIDDVDSIATDPVWEQAMFNFINRMRIQNATIIFSARQNPAHKIFELEDLNSRAVWGPVYHLTELDEKELEHALKLHANTRGLELPERVIKYLFTHFRRDASTLVKLLSILDYASLQEKRKLTLPFIKEVLANR